MLKGREIPLGWQNSSDVLLLTMGMRVTTELCHILIICRLVGGDLHGCGGKDRILRVSEILEEVFRHDIVGKSGQLSTMWYKSNLTLYSANHHLNQILFLPCVSINLSLVPMRYSP